MTKNKQARETKHGVSLPGNKLSPEERNFTDQPKRLARDSYGAAVVGPDQEGQLRYFYADGSQDAQSTVDERVRNVRGTAADIMGEQAVSAALALRESGLRGTVQTSRLATHTTEKVMQQAVELAT